MGGPETIDVWLAPVAEVDASALRRWSTLLATGEISRMDALQNPADRDRFVVAHALLRLATAATFSVPVSHVSVSFRCAVCGAEHGRPLVSVRARGAGGSLASCSVSSASAAGVVLVAVGAGVADDVAGVAGASGATSLGVTSPWVTSSWVTPSWVTPRGVTSLSPAQIGVDIESASAVAFDGFDDVALTPNERRMISSTSRVAQTLAADRRAQLWTRKEAVLKATGEGLRHDPALLEVADGVSPQSTTGLAEVAGKPVRWLDVALPRGERSGALRATVARSGSEKLAVTLRDGASLLV